MGVMVICQPGSVELNRVRQNAAPLSSILSSATSKLLFITASLIDL